SVPKLVPDIFHRLGIVRFDGGSVLEQFFQDIKRWCFPDIIGIGLERKPPYTDRLSTEISTKMMDQFLREYLFLPVVYRDHRAEDLKVIFIFFTDLDQGLDVFGKTGSSVPHAGKQEPLSNPGVGTDPDSHLI